MGTQRSQMSRSVVVLTVTLLVLAASWLMRGESAGAADSTLYVDVTSDATAAPLKACASAYLASAPEPGLGDPVSSGCSFDDTGTVVITGLTVDERYLVKVAPNGGPAGPPHFSEWAQDAETPAAATAYTAPARIQVGLRPAGVLTGRLTAFDGQPVGGAQVYFYPRPFTEARGPIITGEDGTWATQVPPGEWKVSFTYGRLTTWAYGKPGLTQADVVTVEPGQTLTVDASLPGTSTVSGTVTDTATGAPLMNMCVSGSAADGSYGAPPAVCTGADGTYSLTVVSPDTWTLQAEDPTGRYAAASSGPLTTRPGEALTGVTLRMSMAGTISGTVVDRPTGTPLAGVCPSAFDGNTGTAVRSAVAACSDAEGAWSLAGLGAGRFTVLLTPSDGIHQQHWALDAETQAAATRYAVISGSTVRAGTIRLPRGGTISGRITDRAGRPIAGATVNYGPYNNLFGDGGQSAYTDTQGRYTITNVDQGSDLMLVSAMGQPYAWRFSGGADDPADAKKVSVRYGQVTRFDATLGPQAKLSVRISGSNGGDSAQYGIHTFTPGGAAIGFFTNISGNGTKPIEGLPPGTYKVRVSLIDGSYRWYRNATSLSAANSIRATTGRQTTVTVQVPE